MRKIYSCILFIIIIACNAPKSEENGSAIKQKVSEQALKLEGHWLSEPYLKGIEKSKSVYVNREYTTKLFGFTANKENLLSNTPTLFGFTPHEGGYDIPLHFNIAKNEFTNDSSSQKESNIKEPFSIVLDNKLLNMYFPKSGKKDSYRKIVDEQNELRKILFEGDYITSDNKSVTFNKNGSVEGIDAKNYFEVIYDFGLNIDYDAIVLFKNGKGGNWSDGEVYKYEFVSDILKLYHVNTDWENLEHKIEGVTYTLIKSDKAIKK